MFDSQRGKQGTLGQPAITLSIDVVLVDSIEKVLVSFVEVTAAS